MLELCGTICFGIWVVVGFNRLTKPKIVAFVTDPATGIEYIINSWGFMHVRLENNQASQGPATNQQPQEAPRSNVLNGYRRDDGIYHV